MKILVKLYIITQFFSYIYTYWYIFKQLMHKALIFKSFLMFWENKIFLPYFSFFLTCDISKVHFSPKMQRLWRLRNGFSEPAWNSESETTLKPFGHLPMNKSATSLGLNGLEMSLMVSSWEKLWKSYLFVDCHRVAENKITFVATSFNFIVYNWSYYKLYGLLSLK